MYVHAEVLIFVIVLLFKSIIISGTFELINSLH